MKSYDAAILQCISSDFYKKKKHLCKKNKRVPSRLKLLNPKRSSSFCLSCLGLSAFAAFVTHKFSELVQGNLVILVGVYCLEESLNFWQGPLSLSETLSHSFFSIREQTCNELILVKNVVAVLVIEPEVDLSHLLSTDL